MHSFNNLLLPSIPHNKFDVYFPTVTLTKKDRTITGSGHLYQNEGTFIIKIINSAGVTKQEKAHNFLKSINPSTVIDQILSVKDYCYCLEAIDDHGSVYTCEYVDIKGDYEKALYTCEFKSSIFINSGVELSNHKHRAEVVFKNKYTFSTTEQEYHELQKHTILEDDGEWRGVWKVCMEDIIVTLHKNTIYLHLEIESNNSSCLDHEIIRRVIDSLDFVMAEEHKYFYSIIFGEDSSLAKISTNTTPVLKSVMPPPYRKNGSQGDEGVENCKLFECYYKYLVASSNTILPKLQKRIYDSGTGYYYKYGLVISIAIEKILTQYYPMKPSPPSANESDIEIIRKASEKISDAITKKRIDGFRQKLFKNEEFNPAKKLRLLESQGIIGEKSEESWRKLRNTYAHGDDYNDNMEKAIGLVRHNITIYYELIFNIIEYEGKYTSFAPNNIGRLKIYKPQSKNIENEQ